MEEILKNFKIVFSSDTRPLQQGVKEAENSLEKLGRVMNSLIST